MKFKPVHNNVVLEQQELTEEKHGNIIIADTGKERPRLATVVAIGPGMVTINGNTIPCQVKVGDKVAYPAFGGTVFSYEGTDYVVVKDTDILTIIE